MAKYLRKGDCSRCGIYYEGSHRSYCGKCWAKYTRETRKPLLGDALLKANARSYANVYKRRGKLIPKPCEVCGEAEVQMHHEDYTKPLDVRWLCKIHHAEHHAKEEKKICHTQ